MLAYRSSQTAHLLAAEIESTLTIHTELETVQALARSLQIGTRGYLINGEDAMLQPYLRAREELPSALEQLSHHLDGKAQLLGLQQLNSLLLQDLSYRSELLGIARSAGLPAARDFVTSRPDVDRTPHQIEAICGELKTGAASQLEEHRRSQVTNNHIVAIAQSAITLLLALGTAAVYAYVRYHLGQRRQAEAQLARQNEALLEANQELESFSYSVSHDLRAPLRHIQGYAGMMQRNFADTLPEKGRRHLQVIADAAAEMGHLIDDLLAFSRASRTQLQHENVALTELVQVVKERVLRTVPANRQIEWQIAPLPVVKGDRALLTQVFTNLISNAVKYTAPRELAKIHLTALPVNNGWVRVSIRDNGVGFDMKYADKLFGVFQRLHRADEFEGTGVGLALVRRIVTKHGGTISADAVKDGGATFHFTLPASAPKRAGTAKAPPPSSPPASPSRFTTAQP